MVNKRKQLALAALVLISALNSYSSCIFDLKDDEGIGALIDNQKGPVTCSVDGITATFSANDGEMNLTQSSFGINATIIGDDTDALDYGEILTVKFNRNVIIDSLDLRQFDEDEVLNVKIGDTIHEITFDSLDNQTSDVKSNLNWAVNANTDVEFYVSQPSSIGMDNFAVSIPEPTTIAMFSFFSIFLAALRRRL